jgi:hypothetical protein
MECGAFVLMMMKQRLDVSDKALTSWHPVLKEKYYTSVFNEIYYS